jgi:hypothetical protein
VGSAELREHAVDRVIHAELLPVLPRAHVSVVGSVVGALDTVEIDGRLATERLGPVLQPALLERPGLFPHQRVPEVERHGVDEAHVRGAD